MRRDKQIYVATMDSQLHCYSLKGQKLFSIRMPAHITNLELLEVRRARVFSAVIVALANGEVRIYNERVLADTVVVNDVVTAVRVFGGGGALGGGGGGGTRNTTPTGRRLPHLGLLPSPFTTTTTSSSLFASSSSCNHALTPTCGPAGTFRPVQP